MSINKRLANWDLVGCKFESNTENVSATVEGFLVKPCGKRCV